MGLGDGSVDAFERLQQATSPWAATCTAPSAGRSRWQVGRAQARRGMSVVLDGMATAIEIDSARDLAASYDTRSLLVLTTCVDKELHRRGSNPDAVTFRAGTS